MASAAEKYSSLAIWQRKQGLALVDLADLHEGEHVLDVGCGTGELTLEIARRVSPSGFVLGVDNDESRISHCLTHIGSAVASSDMKLNIDFQVCPAETVALALPDRAASFDCIFLNHVIHWIKDKERALHQFFRLLRPGGRVVMLSPQKDIKFLTLLVKTHPTHDVISQQIAIKSKEKIQKIGVIAGFTEVLHESLLQHAEQYESFEKMLEWMEGTTHGRFQARLMSAEQYQQLKQIFMQDECKIRSEVFRLILRKPVQPPRLDKKFLKRGGYTEQLSVAHPVESKDPGPESEEMADLSSFELGI
eukprot:TRINITY_DN2743_c0_g1_i2.p1 TRINITY_DN2743_c0_g1~~TRINITY_DN2743_c0_g1_i2.p1  ORF type:complete len:305 (-),score=29.10 TRINITY_DN2743_c0_g1_i2:71-985(-)